MPADVAPAGRGRRRPRAGGDRGRGSPPGVAAAGRRRRAARRRASCRRAWRPLALVGARLRAARLRQRPAAAVDLCSASRRRSSAVRSWQRRCCGGRLGFLAARAVLLADGALRGARAVSARAKRRARSARGVGGRLAGLRASPRHRPAGRPPAASEAPDGQLRHLLIEGFRGRADAEEPALVLHRLFLGHHRRRAAGPWPACRHGAAAAAHLQPARPPPIIMLAGIFYGAMYGGSTTSILVRIPGEAASVVTCIDGYAMAQQGPRRRGADARRASAPSSAARSRSLGLVLFAPPLAKAMLAVGPAAEFVLMAGAAGHRLHRLRPAAEDPRHDPARPRCSPPSGSTSSPPGRASPSARSRSPTASPSCRSRSACSASPRS